MTPDTAETMLTDLKHAIEKVERYKQAPLNEALHNAVGWCAAERDAWRAAFDWLRSMVESPIGDGSVLEYDEGMKLIRERLR